MGSAAPFKQQFGISRAAVTTATHNNTQTLKLGISLSPFPCPLQGQDLLLPKTHGIAQLYLIDAFMEQKGAAQSNPGSQMHSDQQPTAHTRAVLPSSPSKCSFHVHGVAARQCAGEAVECRVTQED